MDGRVLRGELNRQAIVDAALALVEEHKILPSAHEIADKAGLAKRSIFHHFPDMEALLAHAADTQARRHWTILQLPRPDHALSERIETAVAQRARLFEKIGDVRRVAVLYEAGSPVLAARLEESRSALRRHMVACLEPEVGALDPAARAGLLAMASWETWDVLRRHQGLSVPTARRAVQQLVESAFERSAIGT